MPLNGVTRLPYDGYMGEADTAALLETMLNDASSGIDAPAAILLETVQGEGGLTAASPEWVRRVARIAREHGALLESRLPKGMLVSHFSVLNHLIRVEDGRTPLALARAFQVPKTTMSHTLAVLERRGLVDLRPNPKDARSKLVWLTGAGRQFRDDAIAALAPDMAALAVQFDAADIAELTTKLQEVRVFLDRRRDEPD